MAASTDVMLQHKDILLLLNRASKGKMIDLRIKGKANFILNIFTARKRSLGQGNIFTSVCQELCSQGAASSRGVWSGESLLSGVSFPGGSGPRGFWCLFPGGCLLLEGAGLVETPRDGYFCGRYASYWNAFLLSFANLVNKEPICCFTIIIKFAPSHRVRRQISNLLPIRAK